MMIIYDDNIEYDERYNNDEDNDDKDDEYDSHVLYNILRHMDKL